MEKIKTNLYEFLLCISNAEDLVSPILSNHHQQVAYLSLCIAREIKLPIDEQMDIFLAALVHDIGALSKDERLEIIEREPLYINNHAFIGAKLLEGFKPLKNSARIIKHHHFSWNNGKGSMHNEEMVPIGSHVIHLADRICMRIQPEYNVLSQLPQTIDYINTESNFEFEPNLVNAMNKLFKQEYIWLDLISSTPVNKIDTSLFDIVKLEIDDVVDLALIFSQIIDFRSSFTALHSAGVAKIAERLAQLVGFSQIECKMMLIAGYLHDLGKLAIDNAVLEKPAKLNEDEFNEIRSHTYFTYHLLAAIPHFRIINEWASYHHERLDGKGYPFHINGDNLSLGSRVMAVADVFCAITENRPYRNGMNGVNAVQVLNDMVSNGALDGKIVSILVENFQMISKLRDTAEEEASKQHDKFLQIE